MAGIKFVAADEKTFLSLDEQIALHPDDDELRGLADKVTPAERTARTFTHHLGTDSTPQLFEVKFPPLVKNESHAHDADEIIAVTEGELHFGKRVYGPGSSVLIPRLTLYSFQAGPEGVTFLNFRPVKTNAVIYRDELMKQREARRQETAEADA